MAMRVLVNLLVTGCQFGVSQGTISADFKPDQPQFGVDHFVIEDSHPHPVGVLMRSEVEPHSPDSQTTLEEEESLDPDEAHSDKFRSDLEVKSVWFERISTDLCGDLGDKDVVGPDQCEEAAAALGLESDFETANTPLLPSGCIYQDSTRSTLVYNYVYNYGSSKRVKCGDCAETSGVCDRYDCLCRFVRQATYQATCASFACPDNYAIRHGSSGTLVPSDPEQQVGACCQAKCCWNRLIQECNTSEDCDLGGEGCIVSRTQTKKWGSHSCDTCEMKGMEYNENTFQCEAAFLEESWPTQTIMRKHGKQGEVSLAVDDRGEVTVPSPQ